MLSILTDLIKNIQYQVLMMIIRIPRVKDSEEYLFDKNLNHLLQMLSEVQE